MMDIKLALSLGLPIKLTAQQANGLCQQLINHEKSIAELEKVLSTSFEFLSLSDPLAQLFYVNHKHLLKVQDL
jgi:hypothetical protein|tara:strand:+ start:220 stop:438 length:219 start_codon:yes stop_codon:yes gene_type:complete